MGLKVHIQGIWPSPEKNELLGTTTAAIYEGQDKLMRRVFGADVELRTRFNDRSSYYTSCSSMEAYNVVGMLEGLREAEREGCDVAFISCGNDPGLQAARDLLRIPVVSATESAMLVACMLGGRFGVVTFDDASTVLIERNLRSYGLEERALRVKPARSAGFYEATDRCGITPGAMHASSLDLSGYTIGAMTMAVLFKPAGTLAGGALCLLGCLGNTGVGNRGITLFLKENAGNIDVVLSLLGAAALGASLVL